MWLFSLIRLMKRKRPHDLEKSIKRSSRKSDENLSESFFDEKYGTLVLIGTVKSVEQFETCKKECFYHIPLRQLFKAGFDFKRDLHRIKYVSLYQSISQFKDEAGIEYIAQVESASVLKRCDIKEIPKKSKERYLYFKLSPWEKKNEKIKVCEIGVYPFMVVPFGTFKAAKEITELTIHNSRDREIFRLLRQLSTDVNCTSLDFGEYRFFDENDTLILFRNEQCLLQLPMEVMRELPYSGFETVKEAMKL